MPAWELGELCFYPVKSRQDSSAWNELIERYHYLGYTPPAGGANQIPIIYRLPHAPYRESGGVTYISLFVGRLDGIGTDGMELVRGIRQIYDNYGFETKIIVAAARHPKHILDAALIGADVSTMTFEIMEMLFEHPLTDSGLEKFLKDWEKVPK